MIYANDFAAAGRQSAINSELDSGGLDMSGGDGGGQRFFCTVCDKSYLRKRHLQRHMRDECIGIPPRFQCSMCTSKFRRKYHLVRHLNSKHAVIVTKDNELDMIQKKMKGEPDDSEYMLKQEKLFTENNFLNNEIFSRAMNLMMPTMETTQNSKMLPIIDTKQLLDTMKQQQQSFLAAAAREGGIAGAAMTPMNILQQLNQQQLNQQQQQNDPDQDVYNRFLGFDKMAVNAMMRKQYEMDTDCDSDDVQDLRVAAGTNGGRSGVNLSDSETEVGGDGGDERKELNGTKTSDDFQMKMNIELRPDFVPNRSICGPENAQQNQIIPNDSMN